MWNWLSDWRRYEARVWQHAWSNTGAAGKKVVSTGLGIALSVGLGVVLLGAAVELKSFLPLLVAVVIFFATLWINLALAPSQLDKEVQEALRRKQIEIEELQDKLERKRIDRQQYQALKLLLAEGQELIIQGGVPNWDEWSVKVGDWRNRVYQALPTERDAFLHIASAEMFEAARDGPRRMKLLTTQVEKFRRIMTRIENEVDGGKPKN